MDRPAVIPKYVTPYLPDAALKTARDWERTHQMPAFIWAFNHDEPGTCPNCNGIGGVYLRLAKAGPFPSPAYAKAVVTWFDGDGQFAKGWYVVGDTFAFPCPACERR
jgi:hypothetical protein